jgi:hypothetical protein
MGNFIRPDSLVAGNPFNNWGLNLSYCFADGAPCDDWDGDTVPNSIDVDGDDDFCGDMRELGASPLAGGGRDPSNPWDFCDVPAPALRSGYIGQTRDHGIGLGTDVLAVLDYSGVAASHPDYVADRDGNGIPDGLQYDRTSSTTVGQPWRSGPPDGGIGLGEDVVAAVAQSGTLCAP